MKQHEDRYVAVVERYSACLMALTNTITLMKHKHICDTSEKHTRDWRQHWLLWCLAPLHSAVLSSKWTDL